MVVVSELHGRIVLPPAARLSDAILHLNEMPLLRLHGAEACMDVWLGLALVDGEGEEAEIKKRGNSKVEA